MPGIDYYKNKMDAWGPDRNGNIVNLKLYKGYKAKYDELRGDTIPDAPMKEFVEEAPIGVGKPLKEMTKDELNDMAAREFPDLVIKPHWRKSKIISELEKQF